MSCDGCRFFTGRTDGVTSECRHVELSPRGMAEERFYIRPVDGCTARKDIEKREVVADISYRNMRWETFDINGKRSRKRKKA